MLKIKYNAMSAMLTGGRCVRPVWTCYPKATGFSCMPPRRPFEGIISQRDWLVCSGIMLGLAPWGPDPYRGENHGPGEDNRG